MLGGDESRNKPETFDIWFEAMLSTVSLSSALCWAYSRTWDPTSVSRRLRVERSSRRTPSWPSRSAMRRLTVEVGILRRRAAFEKLFASTTLAKIISELRSDIVIPPAPSGHHSGVTAARAEVVRTQKFNTEAEPSGLANTLPYRDGTKRDTSPEIP